MQNEQDEKVWKFDHVKEIMDLWYELFFFKACMFIDCGNPQSHMTEKQAREYAQKEMKKRFPKSNMEFK